MSWNNVIPAWCLYPHRVRCETDRDKHAGFNTRKELEDYIKSNPEDDFRVLSPPEGETK